MPSRHDEPGKGQLGAQRYDELYEYPVKLMADIKLPSYEVAYNERLKQIGESLKSPYKGTERSRDVETEIRPGRDSVQLGEGAKR